MICECKFNELSSSWALNTSTGITTWHAQPLSLTCLYQNSAGEVSLRLATSGLSLPLGLAYFCPAACTLDHIFTWLTHIHTFGLSIVFPGKGFW